MSNFTMIHLYPETLKFNGESGNVLALQKRAIEFGKEVRLSSHELGDQLPATRPDFLFLGSGTLQATIAASVDLTKNAVQIREWVDSGTKLLAVGTGFDLISQELNLPNGKTITGLGLTNTTHRSTGQHLVGEVFLGSHFAGFINSDRTISRSDEGFHLGVVTASDNKDLIGYLDGFTDGKVWATNVQGPFLPMNPKYADEILASIFPQFVKPESLKVIDGLAEGARNAISVRVGN